MTTLLTDLSACVYCTVLLHVHYSGTSEQRASEEQLALYKRLFQGIKCSLSIYFYLRREANISTMAEGVVLNGGRCSEVPL